MSYFIKILPQYYLSGSNYRYFETYFCLCLEEIINVLAPQINRFGTLIQILKTALDLNLRHHRLLKFHDGKQRMLWKIHVYLSWLYIKSIFYYLKNLDILTTPTSLICHPLPDYSRGKSMLLNILFSQSLMKFACYSPSKWKGLAYLSQNPCIYLCFTQASKKSVNT